MSREAQDELIGALMDSIIVRKSASPELCAQFVQAVRESILDDE